MPRAASPQTLAQALSLYLAYTPWAEISRITGIKQDTIERRAQREGWPEKRAEILPNVDRVTPDSAQTWVLATRQECEEALKRFRTYPLPTCLKEEKERISALGQLDEIARRAYGIDKQGNALTVNLNYMRDQPKLVQNTDAHKVIDIASVKPDTQAGS